MSARSLATIAAVVLASVPARAAITQPEPAVHQEAERELAAGLQAYESGDFAAALRHFENAYTLHPDPDYLYAWAQAARSAGDCAAAIDLYRRFIATQPSGVTLEAAKQNVTRCAEQLAMTPLEAPVQPEPTPIEPTPAADEPNPSIHDDGARRSPDRVGLSLLVSGGGLGIAGSALLAVAGARQAAQAKQTSYQAFHDLDAGIDRLYVAGGVTLGIGVALTMAGAIRLALRSRRGSASPRTVVVPALDGGTPMVFVRFAGPPVFAGRGRGRSSDR